MGRFLGFFGYGSREGVRYFVVELEWDRCIGLGEVREERL